MSDFASLAIGSIAVIPLILGLVQFAKKFGLDGNGNIILAVVLGILFGGVAYGIDQVLIPAIAIPYIKWGAFALSVGLGAAGFYDLGKTKFGTVDK